MIYVFGDSHTIIFSKINITVEHWLGFNTNLPITMYRFGNEGLDIQKAPIIIGNGHEKYIPIKGDTIIYSYGYNDIQKNIVKQLETRNEEDIINSLIDNYLYQIKINEQKFNVKSIVYGILPPPTTINVKNLNIIGSLEKRVELTKKMNMLLEKKCIENNILFFNIYYEVEKNGCLNSEYTVDGIHINLDLYKKIEDLLKLNLTTPII